MPRTQTIRRWLWRLNGAMAVVALLAWASALLDPPDVTPPAVLEPPRSGEQPQPWRASAAWEEIVAEARPWLGSPTPSRQETPAPEVVAPPPGRLPLAAFEVTCHIHDPAGADLVVLKSKDPAHPETYMPEEDEPDGGIAIERIWREPGVVKIAVRRDRETFTYDFAGLAGFDPRGVCRRVAAEREGGPESRPSSSGAALTDPAAAADVKIVPFFGPKGELVGGRVTGVRPGSRLKAAGLRPGDLVVGVDGGAVASVDRLRIQLRSDQKAGRIDVRRGVDGPRFTLALGG